jgi:hypothetical protein
LKIWLDDIRQAPEGYVQCKSVNEAIAIIEDNKNNIEVIDLDHDLGDFAKDGGDAICLMDYLVANELFYKLNFHTANPVGLANMKRMHNRYWK